MKIFKSIIFLLIGFLAISNTSYAQSAASNAKTEQVAEETKTISIKVKGVGCANDIKSIAANVENLDNVAKCEAKRPGRVTTFTVVYNPALVKMEDIHAAIEGTPGCQDPKDRPYKVKKK